MPVLSIRHFGRGRGRGLWLPGRLRLIRSLLEGVVLLCAIGGAYYLMTRPDTADLPSSTDTRTQVKTIDQAALDTWYPQPQGPNAAAVYRRAFNAYTHTPGLLTLPEMDGVLSYDSTIADISGMADRIGEHVRANTEAIALLEEATRIEDCRFDFSTSQWGELVFTHHDALKRGIELLYWSAVLEADQGQVDTACQRVDQINRMASTLSREPALTSSLRSCRARKTAYDLAEHLVDSGRLTPDQLDSLAGALNPRAARRDVLTMVLNGQAAPPFYIPSDPDGLILENLRHIANKTDARQRAVLTLIEAKRRAMAATSPSPSATCRRSSGRERMMRVNRRSKSG